MVRGQLGRVIRQTAVKRLMQTAACALFMGKSVRRLSHLTPPDGAEGVLTKRDFNADVSYTRVTSAGVRELLHVCFLKNNQLTIILPKRHILGRQIPLPFNIVFELRKIHRKFADKFSYSLLKNWGSIAQTKQLWSFCSSILVFSVRFEITWKLNKDSNFIFYNSVFSG